MFAVVTLAVSNMLIREEQARTGSEKIRAEQAQTLSENVRNRSVRNLNALRRPTLSWIVDECIRNGRDGMMQTLHSPPRSLYGQTSPVWAERGSLFAMLGL